MELTNTNNINVYKEIIKIRQYLKGVQQLSWDINNLDKRYPLDSVSEESLEDILRVYEDLRERLLNLQVGMNDGQPF